MRQLIKKIIHWSPWPLTRSERYDRQTHAILKKVCKPDSICVDVGCFKGEILQAMMSAAPDARHIAFEPVPEQYTYLKNLFDAQVIIHPFALGNENKESSFQFVVSNPTYSGLKPRQYIKKEDIQVIQVQVRKMDEIISHDLPIALIKIDVEGGEYDVIKGGSAILRKWHPYIIFEHGMGGADKYGIEPKHMYQLLVHDLGYKIYLMGAFLKNQNAPGLTLSRFEMQFWKRMNCYFIAAFPGSTP